MMVGIGAIGKKSRCVGYGSTTRAAGREVKERSVGKGGGNPTSGLYTEHQWLK